MFTSLVLSMAAATKKEKKRRKEEAYPWKAGASSRHKTNLKQSILETIDIYGFNCKSVAKVVIILLVIMHPAIVDHEFLKCFDHN